jgi:hypothetical protein
MPTTRAQRAALIDFGGAQGRWGLSAASPGCDSDFTSPCLVESRWRKREKMEAAFASLAADRSKDDNTPDPYSVGRDMVQCSPAPPVQC